MTNRRTFIKAAGLVGAGLWAYPSLSIASPRETKRMMASVASATPSELAQNEDFWSWIRLQYSTSSSIINLNNGGVSPHPRVVEEATLKFERMANDAPSYYMWRVLEKNRTLIRTKLSDMAGVSADEIAINRNATEAMDTIIFGIDLKKGDEVVHSNFIYPNMNQAWAQREMREGISRKIAKLKLPSSSTKELVKAYTDQFTAKTKVVHITHVINWTGQVMPVREIADAAKAIGAKVVVDGAHSFAHLDFKIPDLNCDYFGTSLHKWLCGPFGTGMLYVKKEHISNLWPLFPNEDPKSNDIIKFEAQGTRNIAAELAIGEAIDFHLSIGAKRKYERLCYLKNYWTEKVKDVPGIEFWTPLENAWSGAIVAFGFKNDAIHGVSSKMWEDSRIHTTTIKHEGIEACRVTPHVYTSLEDLDLLVKAIHKLA